MVNVPQQYQSYVQDAASFLGIPYDVVAAQIGYESSFNPTARSGAGAEGIAQFMPGTFAQYGPKGGSPWNVADAFYAYKNYMGHLLAVEGKNVQRALAAYNAGEGNVGAGMGYADHILSVSGQQSSLSQQSGSQSSTGGTQPAGQQGATKIDAATLAEQYGFTQTFLDANPELKKIFDQAVASQWSTDRFTAALQNTNWFKTHSADERKWLLLASTDPASAGQQWNQARVHLAQLLAGQGSSGMNTQAYNTLVYNIVAKGWNDQQIQNFAGQYVKLINGKMSGDAETQYSNALQYAYSMGVKMSDSWYQTNVQKLEQGLMTQADLQAGIRAQAKAQYSQFATQIDGGQTIQDLASPYIQQMSNILEVNGSTLSAFDPTIKKALTYKDPTTGQAGSQPLWQFEDTLRQDPRWLQTNNARDSMMTVAHGVLQQMGMAF